MGSHRPNHPSPATQTAKQHGAHKRPGSLQRVEWDVRFQGTTWATTRANDGIFPADLDVMTCAPPPPTPVAGTGFPLSQLTWFFLAETSASSCHSAPLPQTLSPSHPFSFSSSASFQDRNSILSTLTQGTRLFPGWSLNT